MRELLTCREDIEETDNKGDDPGTLRAPVEVKIIADGMIPDRGADDADSELSIAANEAGTMAWKPVVTGWSTSRSGEFVNPQRNGRGEIWPRIEVAES